MTPILRVDNVSRRFADGTTGLSGVQLAVGAGEFVILAGRNGSGKTTLLRHLNGLLLPDSGQVLLNGKSVADHLAWARQFVGMVFQDPDGQIVGETVRDDVSFGPENLGLPPDEIEKRVERALADVDLVSMAYQRPHVLSGGEKRRLAIAGVLAMNPDILVFDEPFSSLDYPGVCQILNQLRRLKQQGHTLIVSSHELERIMPMADRLVVIENGRIEADGSPEEVSGRLADFGVRPPCAACMAAGDFDR